MSFKSIVLNNGLSVISEFRPNAESVAIGFFVKTGARDETPEVSGVSHFLEHMMFKGTNKRSALDITYEMGAIGAQANAFTSEESTVYYMAVLPEYFETALELLSDMLRPSLVNSEFDMEKKVILEEIALYQDRPTFVLFEKSMEQYFANHSAGNSVLGSVESITALSRDQMKSYFDSRYTPSNITLAVSGAFDQKQLEILSEKFCANWDKLDTQRTYATHVPQSHNQILYRKDLNRGHVMLLAPGPDVLDPRRYDADILSTILGDSSGSKAYWALVDKGIADSASIDSEQMDGVGVVYGYASAEPERIEEVSQILRSILLSPDNFSSEDLSQAKTKARSRLALQGESNMKRMMTIGFDWVYGGEYVPLEEELSRLNAVNKDSIAELLSEFSLQPVVEMRMLPEVG